MNNGFLFARGYWLFELLTAAVVVFLITYYGRMKPDGIIARWLRHRDRIWFALLLLFVPMVALRYFLFNFPGNYPMRGSSQIPQIVNMFFIILNGVIYSLAGCWFASPAKKEDRFNYGVAFMVTFALLVLASALSMVINAFTFKSAINEPVILAVLVTLAFIVSRFFVGKNLRPRSETALDSKPAKTGYDPASAFIWLLVGLVPIPILLVIVSSNSSRPLPPALGVVMLIICPACNLLGAFGCLGGIKNVAVRVVLGIFLALFFFGLSALVALLQACSHSGGI